MIEKNIVIYSLVLVLVSVASGSIPLIISWPKRVIRLFISYGAGVLLAVAFLHMVPEAIDISGHSTIGIFLLTGFSCIFIMEKFIMMHPCDEHACDFHYIGLTALYGLSVHSLIVGFSLGFAMRTGSLGWMVFLAIIIHKIPESFSLTSLLSLGKKYSRNSIFFIIFFFSLLVPIGMIVAAKLLVSNHKITGYAVAIAAGTFIEIAACDILPELHRSGEWRYKNLTAFVLGLFSIGILGLLE